MWTDWEREKGKPKGRKSPVIDDRGLEALETFSFWERVCLEGKLCIYSQSFQKKKTYSSIPIMSLVSFSLWVCLWLMGAASESGESQVRAVFERVSSCLSKRLIRALGLHHLSVLKQD